MLAEALRAAGFSCRVPLRAVQRALRLDSYGVSSEPTENYNLRVGLDLKVSSPLIWGWQVSAQFRAPSGAHRLWNTAAGLNSEAWRGACSESEEGPASGKFGDV